MRYFSLGVPDPANSLPAPPAYTYGVPVLEPCGGMQAEAGGPAATPTLAPGGTVPDGVWDPAFDEVPLVAQGVTPASPPPEWAAPVQTEALWTYGAAGPWGSEYWQPGGTDQPGLGTPVVTGRVPATCPPGWTRRRVFPEETIDSLTHFAGITREQFLAANPHIRFPSEVRPGDVVCLPVVRTCPAGSMAMRVFAGVTLRQIAAAQGITLAALMTLNPHLAGVGPDVRLFGGTLVCVPAAPLRCPPGWGPYVVQPGDTLFLLARRFGTTVEALLGANPQIVSPEQLRAGMVICVPIQIPPPPPPPPCPPGWGTYRVQPGDTLFNIARRFGTTVEQLLRANPQITRPELIFPGQIICVPVAPVCPAGWRPYVVRPGDTLWDIARRAGITLTALIRANPQITDPNRIFPGDIVCVPATAPMGAGTEGLAGLAGGTVAAEGQAQPGEGKPAPAGAAVSAAGAGAQALAETGFGFQQIVCPVGWEPYIVRSGDTLFTLAQRFGTTIDALLANNPEIVNPNQLQIGQQICVPRRPIAACPAGWAPYVVRTGDTLSSIAVAFGTTVSELLRMNPQITNPELIYIGQVICVPAVPVPPPPPPAPAPLPPTPPPPPPVCPAGWSFYRVQVGDTLAGLARRTGTTVLAIVRANPSLTAEARLVPGMTICLPAGPTCPRGWTRYVVQPGDTFFRIAATYGITTGQLAAANPHIPAPEVLRPGDILCVPGAAAFSAAENPSVPGTGADAGVAEGDAARSGGEDAAGAPVRAGSGGPEGPEEDAVPGGSGATGLGQGQGEPDVGTEPAARVTDEA